MSKDNNITGGRKAGFVKVKTAKGRKASSTQWLQRQLNDPYVKQAGLDGYRSRAAYKIIELDEKFDLFGCANCIVDLGAAPGSWTQVAVEKAPKGARIIGLDLQEVDPLEGAHFILGDFLEESVLSELEEMMPRKADVVMSDMAASACGHEQTDYIRIMALCEIAMDFAIDWLKPDGKFVAKVLRGGAEKEILQKLKKHFLHVKHFKPSSSRKNSAEIYVVATGFKG